MTEPLTRLFERLAPDTLRNSAAAAFDTRPRWHRCLSGAAGSGIIQKLGEAGARVMVPTEGFFIQGMSGTAGGKIPALTSGELDRA
ncbi:MAG: hypothetical protein ACHQ4H_14320, partial [Ktedonobacterales bacterium]